MTLKNSIGTALAFAGLAIGVPGFALHSVAWLLGGCLLFFIGLLLYRSPKRGHGNQGAADDDPGDFADLGDLGDLGDIGDSGDGHHSAGD